MLIASPTKIIGKFEYRATLNPNEISNCFWLVQAHKGHKVRSNTLKLSNVIWLGTSVTDNVVLKISWVYLVQITDIYRGRKNIKNN